ncbi:MAG: muconate cycloisomerase [Planctomycetaceae bacterium]|nr:muconate cycloisomerase [Planctomycetaceae bacterium]
MKITKITCFPVRIPLKPEYHMISALGQHQVSKYLLVSIETERGINGVGEATVMPRWSGETVWSAKAIIEEIFAPAITGLDTDDIEGISKLMDRMAIGNWFAKSAIEMALWDIRGKEQDVPVYELLGGPVRDRTITCRFSMGAYPVERARTRARELVEKGFTTIKVKVGTNPEEDVARVRAVREAIGDDYEIVIDANCGFDADTAIDVARQLADCNVALFEQPTPRDDYAGLARVREAIDAEVMADDICFDLNQARECLRNNACDVISVYPGKNAGIRQSMEIASLTAEQNVACSIGSNLELDVASAAMCHLVVAHKNMQVERFPGDIMGPDYHSVSVVKEPLVIEGPTITITDRPGLGIDVDWDVVSAHLI